MKRRFARLLIVAIALTGLAIGHADAYTVSGPGVLVTLKDSGGHPLQGIALDVYDKSSGNLVTAAGSPDNSDANGQAFFSGSVGQDLVVCAEDNYYPAAVAMPPVPRSSQRYTYQCWNNTTTGSATNTGGTPIPITTSNQQTPISMTLVPQGLGLSPQRPWVTGTYAVGAALTAHPGSWTPSNVTLSYQWYRGTSGTWAPISGATGQTYVPTDADQGHDVIVNVTGTLAGYVSVTVDNGYDSPYTVGNTNSADTASISGSLVQGQTLTAVDGNLSPAATGYFPAHYWYVGGQIVGWGPYFSLPAAYVGQSVTLVTTYNNGNGSNTSVTLTTTNGVVQGTLTAPTPTVAGTRVVGSRLTANAGAWGPAPVSLSYQWYRSGAAIAGATASSYLLTAADYGKALTVKVTGTKANYITASKTSASSGTILRALAVGWPAIRGTARVGSILSASPGTWGPAPVTLRYQWFRVTPSNGALTPIYGATGSSFKLTTSQRGYYVRVRVTGYKTGYATAFKYSANSAKVG